MKPTVRATCPHCGDVELGVEEVTALVCTSTGGASYSFLCPVCERIVAKPTDQSVLDILVASGAQLRRWRMPLELEEAHSGPTLAEADLAALRRELADDSWIDRVTAMVARRNADPSTGR